MNDCAFDELFARWRYWTQMTPEPATMTKTANLIVIEAFRRLASFGLEPFPEDAFELAMALACGDEG